MNPAPPAAAERLRGRELGLLLGLALVARLACWTALADLPTLRHPVMDAARYDRLARALVERDFTPGGAFYQDPLYPFALGALYALPGPDLLAARLAQLLASVAAVGLLAGVATSLAGRRAGLATGLLAAFYGPFLFHAPLIGKPTLLFLVAAALLALLARQRTRERPGRLAFAVGVLLGLLGLLAGNLLLLGLPLVVELARRGARVAGRRGAVGAAVLLVAGTALAVLPATAVNLAHGELALTSTNAGVNFWIGNARGATGTFRPLTAGTQDPDRQQADARELATALARRGDPAAAAPQTAGEVSRALVGATIADLRRDPAGWLRLMVRKVRLFWSAYSIPEAESAVVYAEHAPLLRVAPGFGVLAALGLPGLWVLERRRRGAGWLLAGLVVTTCAAVVLFFVFGRFREAAAPFLLPAAGATLAALLDRGEPARRRVAIAGAALVLAGLVHLPPFDRAARARQQTAARFNLASAGIEEAAHLLAVAAETRATPAAREQALTGAAALLEEALAESARVLEVDPDFVVARVENAVAWYRLGLARRGLGDPRAAAAFERAEATLRQAMAHPGFAAVPGLAPVARDLLPVFVAARRAPSTP